MGKFKIFLKACGVSLMAAMLGLVPGCGGGGGAGTASVDGVATPSSISVVTANNAS